MFSNYTGRKGTEKGSDRKRVLTLFPPDPFSPNIVWNNKNLFIYNDSGINEIVKGIKGIRAKNPEFEPKNYVANKGLNEKTGVFFPVFSMMLRGQGSNLRPID